MTSVIAVLMLFGVTFLSASQSAAGSSNTQTRNLSRAEQLDKDAKELIVSGKFSQALDALQSAQRLSPEPQRAQRIDRIRAFVAIRSPKGSVKPIQQPLPPLDIGTDSVPPMPDLDDLTILEDFIDTGSITTTLNLLKQLYGRLTPEQEALLEKQFAQYYAYPADEVKKYFKALNRELFQLLVLKTRLSIEMEGYGQAAAEAHNALLYNSEQHAQTASRHLLKRRWHLLMIQQQLATINHHLNNIGSPPDAELLKKKREKEFEAFILDAVMGNQHKPGNQPAPGKVLKTREDGTNQKPEASSEARDYVKISIDTQAELRQTVSKPYSIHWSETENNAVLEFRDARVSSNDSNPLGDVVATFSWNKPAAAYGVKGRHEVDDWESNRKATQTWEIGLSSSSTVNVIQGAVLLPIAAVGMNAEELYKTGTELRGDNIRFTQDTFKQLGRNQGVLAIKCQVLSESGTASPTVLVYYKFKLQDQTGAQPGTGNVAEYETPGKMEFYSYQINLLKEEIAVYRQRLNKATSVDQQKKLEWLILGKQADMQQQEDLLRELKTGEFKHTKTAWDERNATLAANRFIAESNRYQLKMQRTRFRHDIIGKIGALSKKMIAQDELGVRDWAMRQRTQALKVNDNQKLAEIYAALQKRYRHNLERKRVDADQDVAYWDDAIEGAEYVKDKADTAFLIASVIQSGGSTYLYAGYTGLTNGISDGIASGVEHALKNLNMATMVAGSAYDGYNVVNPETGKKEGFKGAAKNVAVTLAILGACHVAIKAVGKTSTVARNAYKKYALESALTAQEREMSLTLVARYEDKLAKLEQMIQRGEPKAVQKQAELLEKETVKLMANPHAKNYLKYRGAPMTQRAYIHFEQKVRSRIEQRLREALEKKGWRNFRLKEFRNKSSANSVGMDWDLGLIEDDLETAVINGQKQKVLYKNGQPMTVQQFQEEAGKEFNRVYYKETRYSAEGSFATLTTSVNEEAFKDVAILTDASKAAKRYARSTERTVRYKAEHMMSSKSQGFVTKLGKLSEASRGLAKEIRTKLIENLRLSKNKLYLKERIANMQRLQVVLQDFGENRIDAVTAERAVRNLTGKSLADMPGYISRALRKAILEK